MNKSPRRRLGVSFLAACLLMCGPSAWPPARARAEAPKKEKSLADYFGFKALEIYKIEHRISNLAIQDLDGDKIGDIIVGNNARSRIELLLSTKKPEGEAANRPFRKDPNELTYDRRMRLANVPVNKEIVSLDVGDFNGDGKADIVYYGTPAEIQILFNEGGGRFGGPKRIKSGDGTERASALAVGDFDQDGRDDLALLADHELVFVYQTAPGTMSSPERVPHTAEGPWLIKAVDVNGDGAKDLVLLDSAGDHPIHIRFATEEKKLGPEQRFAVEMPRAIAFGQIDGHRGSEILTIENQSGRARVLSLDEAGDDESNRWGRLAFFGLPQGTQRGRSLALGDIDGDGRKDVVVTDPSGAQLWAHLQSGRAGLGAGQAFPSLVGARTVQLADLDGDRKDEVYVLSVQEKQIGSSGFSKGRLSFPAPLPIVGEPVGMVLADLDGDRVPEVVYVARTKPEADSFVVRALKREKSGKFASYHWVGSAEIALEGVKAPPSELASLDINRDGLADLLVFHDYGPPQLLLGRKDGPLKAFSGGLGPLTGASASAINVMDLDGPAVLVGRNTFARRVRLSDDDRWDIQDQFNAGRASAQIQGAAALDFDGDGTKEVVLLDRTSKALLILKRKDGVYRPIGDLAIGSLNFQGMHVADFDGDGRDDLLIAGSDRFGVLQTGRKGQRLKTIASFESRRNEARLSDLAAGDVNNDGVADVVFSDIGEQSLEIASYGGDSNLVPAVAFKVFERKTFHGPGGAIEPRDMVIGDVDGDQRADIVLIAHDRVLVYRQDPGPSSSKANEKPPVAARSK